MKNKLYAVIMLLILSVSYSTAVANTRNLVGGNKDSIVFQASFANDECGFTYTGDVEGVWMHDSDGYMKAAAFGLIDKMMSFYLCSPTFTLNKAGNVASFEESGTYFGNRWNEEAQLVIREEGGEWQVLDRNYMIGDQNQVKSTGDIEIPSSFSGKTVQVAFKYSSDGHKKAGSWYIRNFKIKAAAASKIKAGIQFEEDKVEYNIESGEPFEAPALINPNNLEVKYYSDNTSVATADELTGKVTVLAEGVAVITAKSAETEKYAAGKASYTINVINAQDAQYASPALRSPMVAIEFTGQRCRYCPNQARGLQDYQDKFGKENYIIAALHHLEGFSKLPENQVSLYNEEAMKYAESLEIHDGLPQLAYNSLGPWRSDSTLESVMKEDDIMECLGTATYNSNNEYSVSIKTRLRRNQKNALEGRQVDVILWTLENKIVAFQDDNGNYTYPEHNHIFRGSINTTWGEPYEVGTEYNKIFKAPSSVSDINNTEILAIFIDHDSRIIIDACSFAAVPGETGIENVVSDRASLPVYNLMGMKVDNTVKGGLYIKNGKKFIAD